MSDAEAAMSPSGQVGDARPDDTDGSENIDQLDDVEGLETSDGGDRSDSGEDPSDDDGDPSSEGAEHPDQIDDESAEEPHVAESPVVAEPERGEADLLADDLEVDLVGVDDALKRLDDGTYGTCATCGAALDDAKLEENPTASVCEPACAQPQAAEPAAG